MNHSIIRWGGAAGGGTDLGIDLGIRSGPAPAAAGMKNCIRITSDISRKASAIKSCVPAFCCRNLSPLRTAILLFQEVFFSQQKPTGDRIRLVSVGFYLPFIFLLFSLCFNIFSVID